MNADGKIYIIVTDKVPGGPGPAPTPPAPTTPKPDKKDDLFSHWARDKLLGELKSLVNNSVSYAIGNIGNFTGNYTDQIRVQESVSFLKSIAGIGFAALAGSKYGPAGAVLGASIAVINRGVQFTQTIVSQSVAQKKFNREIEQLRERSGLNPYIDGSRGTEN